MRTYFQVGIIVPDLEAAMKELGKGLGVEWLEPQERQVGEWHQRITFSKQQPYLELIQGEPGGPWDTSVGPHLDHLGFWTDDVDQDKQNLDDAGAQFEREGISPNGGGWVYYQAPRAGFRIELCMGKEAFHQRWGLADEDE